MKTILKNILLIVAFSLSVWIIDAPLTSAQLPDVCQSPENVLPNCNFDNGLDKWDKFLEAGNADMGVLYGGGECHAPLCPAAHIVTDDHFVGGIYQQVSVTPGNIYYANIIWLVFDSLVNDASINNQVGGIGRRIGIDPFGGTDSRSPNVVWSQDNWRNDCKICGVEEVSATAQADKITIFLRLDDTWRLRAREKGFSVPPSDDQFWIDDIGLKQIGEGDVVVVAEPTEAPTEPSPPTDTPVPEPAAGEGDAVENSAQVSQAQLLVAAETEPMTEDQKVVDEEESTEEPVAPVVDETPATSPPEVPSPTNTIAPPPTLTPTNTPEPTATVVVQTLAQIPPDQPATEVTALESLDSPAVVRSSRLPTTSSILGVIGTLGCLGGTFVVIMGVVLVAMTWLYRLGWGNVSSDDDDDFDDVEQVEVEFI